MLRIDADHINFNPDYSYTFNGIPFTGIAYELDSDGVLISEMEFANGTRNGSWKSFYASGQLESATEYNNNTIHGFDREWDVHGQLTVEAEYEYGICTRSAKSAHPSTAATAARIVGPGSRRDAHSSTVAGRPAERLRNRANFTSR